MQIRLIFSAEGCDLAGIVVQDGYGTYIGVRSMEGLIGCLVRWFCGMMSDCLVLSYYRDWTDWIRQVKMG